jgi:mannose-6-phosphate isomerase-like protein (cupin superfamily)
MTDVEKIDLSEKFGRFSDRWSPKIVAEVNGVEVRLAKVEGEFVWHSHADEDELFLVVRGELTIRLRDGEVKLGEGQLAVVPRGVEHLPVAEDEVHVLVLTPKSTVNTGETGGDRTRAAEWI